MLHRGDLSRWSVHHIAISKRANTGTKAYEHAYIHKHSFWRPDSIKFSNRCCFEKQVTALHKSVRPELFLCWRWWWGDSLGLLVPAGVGLVRDAKCVRDDLTAIDLSCSRNKHSQDTDRIVLNPVRFIGAVFVTGKCRVDFRLISGVLLLQQKRVHLSSDNP